MYRGLSSQMIRIRPPDGVCSAQFLITLRMASSVHCRSARIDTGSPESSSRISRFCSSSRRGFAAPSSSSSISRVSESYRIVWDSSFARDKRAWTRFCSRWICNVRRCRHSFPSSVSCSSKSSVIKSIEVIGVFNWWATSAIRLDSTSWLRTASSFVLFSSMTAL